VVENVAAGGKFRRKKTKSLEAQFYKRNAKGGGQGDQIWRIFTHFAILGSFLNDS
jgi:hypothetical protein